MTQNIPKRSGRIPAAVLMATVIAIPAEGLRQYAYYDPPGILTVCYGSTTDVQKGKRYSLAECRERLDRDMLNAVMTVERCVPGLPENKLAAFGDAVYNIGPKIACDPKASTAARLLKAGKWDEACKQLLRWDKARVAGQMVTLPGLTKRRQAEYQLCIGSKTA
jgi:GH24 family phage-related lysozyme (muramidase)